MTTNKYIESNVLELKERVNDKLVKEIVAFLNTNGGKIFIGIKDDGQIIGIQHVDDEMKNIADIIYTQIDPVPQELVQARLLFEEGKVIVEIEVSKGAEPLYCIKKYGFSSVGCLVRVGTTCREMSNEQIKKRYLQRLSDYDLLSETKTNLSELSFSTLKNFYAEKGYSLNEATFKKNLHLIRTDGYYNVMAELLSDENRYSFIFVKFKGENKASISQRSDYGRKSLLFAYEQMINRISSENICYTDTSVRPRIDVYLYDFDAVNEAIVNAIAHNEWMVGEPQVSFFSNRIEILSHGGLHNSLSIEEFYHGISKPKNAMLMKIFSDLNIVDHTGHGVPIIVNKYGREAIEITENHILVTIPFNKEVVNTTSSVEDDCGITVTEQAIVECLKSNPNLNARQLSEKLSLSIRTIERGFSSLQQKEFIIRVGSKKMGHWKVVK